MLEAMPEILKLYPNAHLYVAGADITKGKSLAAKLGVSYGKHIQGLINKFNLIKHITFTGELDEKQICQQFLRANVFVSASNIENSPNSLGEAMLLGVPCVASAVGGVQTLLKENVEGFIYPFDEPYMLAYYVCEVFGKEFLALEFSQNARTHASNTHNREINLKTINEIYKKIHAQ
jgi:glycosyltransferase involved in cell wall biosynthesis